MRRGSINEICLLDAYLKEHGIRRSAPRQKVLEVFIRTEGHLSAAEIHERVKKRFPGVGIATTYRAMKAIAQAGLAEEIDLGDGLLRYEHKYDHPHHDHIVCTSCGMLTEVCDPRIEQLQEQLAVKHGFTVHRHRLQIFGICPKCRGRSRSRAKRSTKE